MIADKIANKEQKLAVIGLGYVGLPIALEFPKKPSGLGTPIELPQPKIINFIILIKKKFIKVICSFSNKIFFGYIFNLC